MVDEIRTVQIAIEHGESMSYQAEIIAAKARNLQTQLIEFEKHNPSPELRASIKALGVVQTILTTNVKELENRLSELYQAQTRYDVRLKS